MKKREFLKGWLQEWVSEVVDRSLAAQAESLAGVEALDIKDLNIGLGHAENLRREEVKKKKKPHSGLLLGWNSSESVIQN